tara:strand:+ start:306 stop:1559 length:1254 start_codon:yes stop_codon:yes gene_type:complete
MAFYNPYRTRPDDETVTQPNFGGVRSVSFTDPTTISRDRALADSLRQQSMTPLNMTTVGGHVIPPSPIQGVAKLGEALVAGLTERRAKQKEEANKQLRSDAVAKALRLQQEGVRDKFEGNVVPNYAFGGSTRREATRPEILGALAEGGPGMENLIAESQIKNLLTDKTTSGSDNRTAEQKNFEFYNTLTEPEQDIFAEISSKFVQLKEDVKQQGKIDFLTIENEIENANIPVEAKLKLQAILKEIKATTQPEADKQQQIEESKLIGKNIATVRNDLAEFEANLPRLQEVVEELGALADIATYTEVGLGVDALKRQAGMDVGKGAIARKEYTSKVDNEILPLLRQTFGAQFTVEEGKALKATLGDPDAHPDEKKAVLKSFIENKVAQIKIKERLLEQITGGEDLSMEELMEKYKEEEE